MAGLSWSASPPPVAFRRQSSAADTLTRLASFIARAESKQGLGKSCKPPPPPFTLPKPHRCSGCGRAFSLRSSLQLHVCDASSQPQTLAGPAHATSLLPDPSRAGQPPLLDRSPYACAPCGRGFMLKQALLHHQQAGCESDEPNSAPASEDDEEDDGADSSSSLYVPDEDNVCKFCARTFEDEAACRRHSLESHSDEADTDSRESWNAEGQPTKDRVKKSWRARSAAFSCRSCDMVFSSTDELSKHRREQHSRTARAGARVRAAAAECKDARAVPIRLRRPTNNTYTCQICSQVFFHHLSLWAHKKKHPSSKPDATPPNKDCAATEKTNAVKKLVPGKIIIRESSVSVARMPPSKFPSLQKCAEVPKACEDEEEVEFPCPSCPQVFSRDSELKAHAELHQSALRRSRCSVCDCHMDALKWPGAKRLRLYHCLLCHTGFSALEPFLTHCQNHLQLRVEEDRAAHLT